MPNRELRIYTYQELMWKRLPSFAKTNPLTLAFHRVTTLRKALKEAARKREFRSYIPFVEGRLEEAQEILDMLMQMQIRAGEKDEHRRKLKAKRLHTSLKSCPKSTHKTKNKTNRARRAEPQRNRKKHSAA